MSELYKEQEPETGYKETFRLEAGAGEESEVVVGGQRRAGVGAEVRRG